MRVKDATSFPTTCDCAKCTWGKRIKKTWEKIRMRHSPRPSAAWNRVCSSRKLRQLPIFVSRPCCLSAITSPGAEDRESRLHGECARYKMQTQKEIVCNRRMVRRRIGPAIERDCRIHRTGDLQLAEALPSSDAPFGVPCVPFFALRDAGLTWTAVDWCGVAQPYVA